MHVSAHTQPGVQEQPPNTLWVAVFLILEDLTGCDLQLHLEKQKNRLHRKPADEKIHFIVSSSSDHIPASSTQAGLSCSTSPPCFSCAASAGAPMPAGHGGIECGFAKMCFYPRVCLPSVFTSMHKGGGIGQLLSKTLLGRFFRRLLRKEQRT